MQIVSLKIKNFLSIGDVEIKPGSVNQIVGKNNQGKTTILKALQFLAKGASDKSVVKFGEDSAEVMVELDDQTTIRRRMSAEGRQFVKVSKGDFEMKSPQAFLDSIFDFSAFNPLELLDPKKRTEAILNSIEIKVDEARLQAELNGPLVKIPMPPLDYTQHGLKVVDQAHKYFYQRRAEANKDVAEKKARWETYSADMPKEEVAGQTREQIQAELDAANKKRSASAERLNDMKREEEKNTHNQIRVAKYQEALGKIDQEIAALEARRAEGLKFLQDAKAEVMEALQDPGPEREKYNALGIEAEKIKAKFEELKKIEAQSKQREMVGNMKKELDEAEAKAEELTKKVEALAGPVKKKLMEGVEMPVDGLEYKDGEFLVDGTPVDNLSSSRALKLALGVARKLSKKSKVICVDGAELLDAEAFSAFQAEAKDDGFTYFVTKVGDSFPVAEGSKSFEMNAGQVVQ